MTIRRRMTRLRQIGLLMTIEALLLSAPSGSAVAQARGAEVAPLTAIVTDTKGTPVEVVDLRIRYWDERQGDNRLDPQELPAFVIQIETQEGPITATDEVTIPFGDLRRVTFPGNYRIEFERRDGSTVVLDQIRAPDWTRDRQRSLQERDVQGAVIKDLKFYEYQIATLKQDGSVLGAKIMRTMLFGGFVGRAKMSSGREGVYFIRANDVKTIEFR